MIATLLCVLANDLPKEAREAFDKAAEFGLYSLDPTAVTDKGFHGWTLLGKTTVKEESARKAREAVLKGVTESDGMVGDCLRPRHALRIVAGRKTYDLVITFQCQSIIVLEGDKRLGVVATTSGPEDALNKILSDAKVPLEGK